MNLFSFWLRNLTLAEMAISVVIVLPVQLLLCFRVRSWRLRFMPVIIFSLAAAANAVMYLLASDWKRQVFSVGAAYILFMLFMCGVAWMIWAFITKRGDRS